MRKREERGHQPARPADLSSTAHGLTQVTVSQASPALFQAHVMALNSGRVAPLLPALAFEAVAFGWGR